MMNRESFKEMVKMLNAERERINELAGLLNAKTTIGGDLIFCPAANDSMRNAYNRVNFAIEALACDYLKMVDPEFYNKLNVSPNISVSIEDGYGTENIIIYAEDENENEISTTL